MKIAIVQMRSSTQIWENLHLIDSFVQDAQEQGAQFIAFPENALYRGAQKNAERGESILHFNTNGALDTTHDFARALEALSQNWVIPVSIGSLLESHPDPQHKPFNTHAIWNPQSKTFTLYQKIHLFQYVGSHASYNESAFLESGHNMVTYPLQEFRAGLSICYDLRFPELYRHLTLKQNADVLLIPAAFTYETGLAHWHTLLRARAIENQCYVIAAAQWGSHLNDAGKDVSCFGHSLVYDPWGNLLCEAGPQSDSLLITNIQKNTLREVRTKLPSLKNTASFLNP